jgi:ADP-ribosylglycohydrolase
MTQLSQLLGCPAATALLGHVAGDVTGSTFERNPARDADFGLFPESSHFTDDTVLTVATADAFVSGVPLADKLREYTSKYPMRGYGNKFLAWAWGRWDTGLNSFGVGAAMRILPSALWRLKAENCSNEIALDAAVTHTHEHAIKAALEAAIAVRHALTWRGDDRSILPADLHQVDQEVPEGFQSDALLCARPAIRIGLEAESWEDAVRQAIMLRADADTQAAIAGGLAALRHGLPIEQAEKAAHKLPEEFLNVIENFSTVWKARQALA